MDLHFNTALAQGYKSASQVARVLTEDWLSRNMYCPVCGNPAIQRATANAVVKDAVCQRCKSQFELKSRRENSDRYRAKVSDGVYRTLIERITSFENPNFLFMHHDGREVNNLVVVPKCFFVPEVIEKRKPLASEARRAGWEGCNILLGNIPQFAKIPIIRNGVVLEATEVCAAYNRAYTLHTNNLESRSWLIDTINCIERLDTAFTLGQVYGFVALLQAKHPDNHHVEAKIRQQLQVLRDKGFIEFTSRGNYRKVGI